MEWERTLRRLDKLKNEDGLKQFQMLRGKEIKKYTPTEATIKKHLETNDKIVPYIYMISPWSSDTYVYSDMPITKIVSSSFYFTPMQIRNMDDRIKGNVIKAAVDGMVKTIRENRQRLLLKDEFFYDDYMKNRVKYLMEKEKEPFVLDETSYEVFEKMIKKVLYKASESHLFVLDEEGKRKVPRIDDKVMLGEFFIEFLEATGLVRTGMFGVIQDVYLVNFEKLTEEMHERFRKLPVCPLTYRLRENPKRVEDIPILDVTKILARKYMWTQLNSRSLKLVFDNALAYAEYKISEFEQQAPNKEKTREFVAGEYSLDVVLAQLDFMECFIRKE